MRNPDGSADHVEEAMMLFPVGSTALYRDEAWAVVAVRASTRELRSLDGRRTIFEPADRLRPAP